MSQNSVGVLKLTAGFRNQLPFYNRVLFNIKRNESYGDFARRYIADHILSIASDGGDLIDIDTCYYVVETLTGVGSKGEVVAHSRNVPESILSRLMPEGFRGDD